MKTISILPAEPVHARIIAPRLREAHLAEARALGIDPALALAEQINGSYESFIGAVDGEIAAVWGISAPSLLGQEAYPWIVTTPLVERNKRAFLMLSSKFVLGWATRFPQLRAFCHIQNEQSARWLEWLGFEEINGVPGFRQFGIGGVAWLS